MPQRLSLTTLCHHLLTYRISASPRRCNVSPSIDLFPLAIIPYEALFNKICHLDVRLTHDWYLWRDCSPVCTWQTWQFTSSSRMSARLRCRCLCTIGLGVLSSVILISHVYAIVNTCRCVADHLLQGSWTGLVTVITIVYLSSCTWYPPPD